MKLAAKKAELAQCPYASEEAKRVLGAASEPPVRCVELGPDRKLKLGGEVVLYRHEKTFVHQTALALNVNDTDSPESIEATLKAAAEYLLSASARNSGSIWSPSLRKAATRAPSWNWPAKPGAPQNARWYCEVPMSARWPPPRGSEGSRSVLRAPSRPPPLNYVARPKITTTRWR